MYTCTRNVHVLNGTDAKPSSTDECWQ